jgi:hypothetical protein
VLVEGERGKTAVDSGSMFCLQCLRGANAFQSDSLSNFMVKEKEEDEINRLN